MKVENDVSWALLIMCIFILILAINVNMYVNTMYVSTIYDKNFYYPCGRTYSQYQEMEWYYFLNGSLVSEEVYYEHWKENMIKKYGENITFARISGCVFESKS